MSEILNRWLSSKKTESEVEPEPTSRGEEVIRRKMLADARHHGATVANDGKGGLPARLVWMRMRKDGWRCKKCGGKFELSVHHKAGATNLVGPAVAALGHKSTMKAIVTICDSCHDSIHDEDRAEE